MKYKVYYSDIWEVGDYPVVNEWIYLREEEIPENYTLGEEVILLFIEEDITNNYELDDLEEVFYILKDGVAILKLEPVIKRFE